ncbi:hypothetical protein BKI52_27500 [marine bacterium AO1-C]|nr:hypothetical protein BKI52_27500 [marine bacterium AO1-C]
MKISYWICILSFWIASTSVCGQNKINWLVKPVLDVEHIWSFDRQTKLAMFKKGGKLGLINQKGKVIVPAIYDDYFYFREGISKVTQNKQKGYINIQGRLIVPVQYQKASNFSGGVAVVQRNNQWLLINNQGAIIATLPYDEVATALPSIIKVVKDKKIGFVDSEGKLIIAPKFTYVNYIGTLIYAQWQDTDQGTHHGFFDKQGKMVLLLDAYQGFLAMREGKIPVMKNKKYGYVDTNGKVVIPFQYDKVYPFEQGIAIVTIDGKQVLINGAGKEVSQRYDKIKFFKESKAAVSKQNKWGAIDINGKEIIPVLYEQVTDFQDGITIAFKQNQGWILDKNGKLQGILNQQYDPFMKFSNRLLKVYKGSKYGYLNVKGQLVIDYQFEAATNFSLDLAPVKLNGKWGIIKTPLK